MEEDFQPSNIRNVYFAAELFTSNASYLNFMCFKELHTLFFQDLDTVD